MTVNLNIPKSATTKDTKVKSEMDRPEVKAFYDKVTARLKEADAHDSKPNDGRVDISVFKQLYGDYGWNPSSTKQIACTTSKYHEPHKVSNNMESAYEKYTRQTSYHSMDSYSRYMNSNCGYSLVDVQSVDIKEQAKLMVKQKFGIE